MHILWINQRADFVGGAERYVADVASMIGRAGAPGSSATPDREGPAEAPGPIRCSLLYGVAGWTEPSFVSRFHASYPIVDLARQIGEIGPDLIYVHQLEDAMDMASIIDAAARLPRRAPVLRFLHDHSLFCLRQHKYRTIGHGTCRQRVGIDCYRCLGFVNREAGGLGVRLRTVGGLEKAIAVHHRLDGVVVGSRYMRDHAILHGFAAEKVHVIEPFVTAARGDPGDRENDGPAATNEAARDPNLLLFVGALLRGKGLDLLLEAMRMLPRPTRLEVVGTGSQEGLYRDLVARLGLADRVLFRGRLNQQELAECYGRALCLVVPSRTPETFGLVGPEAMLSGMPVVAAAVGGVGEWLHDGETGLAFASGDVGGLAAALRTLLADPARAAELGDAGRTLVRRSFTPERHRDALLRLMQRVRRSGRLEAAAW